MAHLHYRPNPYFVGREDTLNQIHEKLFQNPTTALTQGHVEAITALGGVGKTTLARQYAEKFWRCYRQMFWVDCRKGLEAEFAAIHDVLRPEPVYQALKNADKAGWVRYELNRTAQDSLRLLILDNAEDEASVLAWIPKTGNCHTVITSRFTAWSPGIGNLPVWVLPPEPARELLLRRAGRAMDEETEVCDELARKLGYLPLALEQAGAYVGEQGPGYRFASYLKLYEENERKLLGRKVPGGTEYPASVYLTWRATMEKLPPGARAILRLCAALAPTPIPVGLFLTGVEIVLDTARRMSGAEIEDVGEFEIREWKSALGGYSMIRLEAGDSFSVHGLVQAVERHQVGADDQSGLLERTVNLLVAWAPADASKFENWPAWKVLLPHAEALWERVRDNADVRPNPRFLNSLGLFQLSQGLYTAAELPLRRALEAFERVLGAEHPNTLSSVNNLAFLLETKGDYGAAEPLYRRALEARERVLGAEHPNTLTSVNNLAGLLDSKGDYGAAEPLYRRALEAQERVLGVEHPNTLTSVNNLAELLRSKGDYGAAEPLVRRSLEARERVLGAEHPDTLLSLQSLADLLAKTGRHGEAQGLRKIYRSRMADKESDSPPLALRQLALECYRDGDLPHAEQLLRRVLASNFEVPATHCLLARVLLLLDRDADARLEVAAAWESRAEGPPYIVQRILYFQLLFALLDGEDPAPLLQQLRLELARPEAFAEWEIEPMLEHLKLRLHPHAFELLHTIAEVINDRAAMPKLEAFPEWPRRDEGTPNE